MEANAKLYVFKYDRIYNYDTFVNTNTAIFMANVADYGGTLYTDDNTNSGTCNSDTKTECFLQVLAVHGQRHPHLETQCIYFSKNYVNNFGSTLYGGLLDRCAVSQFAEVNYKKLDDNYIINGTTYFNDISYTTKKIKVWTP